MAGNRRTAIARLFPARRTGRTRRLAWRVRRSCCRSESNQRQWTFEPATWADEIAVGMMLLIGHDTHTQQSVGALHVEETMRECRRGPGRIRKERCIVGRCWLPFGELIVFFRR